VAQHTSAQDQPTFKAHALTARAYITSGLTANGFGTAEVAPTEGKMALGWPPVADVRSIKDIGIPTVVGTTGQGELGVERPICEICKFQSVICNWRKVGTTYF
jgi:hypothetical protein